MKPNIINSRLARTGVGLLSIIAMCMTPTWVQAATVSMDLCARSGTMTLPDGANTIILGYTLDDCTPAATLTAPGGPPLTVNQGDALTITLHNSLTEDSAIVFQGQSLVPDRVGAPANGGSKVYSFTASRPGTFLYEAGLMPNGQHQAAMGLHGALIVNPATAGQAYADPGSTYDASAVLVLSEIDPALNAAPTAFDMRNFKPKYFLINGKAYPGTKAIQHANGDPINAGEKVLLRYVNAGMQHHSMTLLGLSQNIIANDGNPAAHALRVISETIAPGQTLDAIATVLASGTKYPLYDGNLLLHNSNASGLGGMLTFIDSGATSSADAGPVTSNVALTPNKTSGGTAVTLTATITTGTGTVTAAEYFVDTVGTSGSGCALTGSWTATIPVSGATAPCADLATLSSGNHSFYVHGRNDAATPKWGAVNFGVLTLDKAGPTTSAVTMTPNPSNGTSDVALSATGDDATSGNSNIVAAEYFIDASGTPAPGTGTTMTVNNAAPSVSLTATIPTATLGLAAGTHTVSVRSQDDLGNWGAFATGTMTLLTVDATGPVTGNVSASPNPSNGKVGLNSSTPAVRLTATVDDGGTGNSKITAAEAFIDTVGTNGTGIVMVPSDGAWNSVSENIYGDIPLSTVSVMADGTHNLYVHGKDAAGNWGATNAVVFTVDKTAPSLSSITLIPNTIVLGASSVLLNVTASDSGTGISGGIHWFDGTATPPGTASAFTGTSATIDTSTLAAGAHTLYARVSDQAGNVSTVLNAPLWVISAVNDSLSITANTNATQSQNVAAPGLLANDQPLNEPGRTANLVSGPSRTSGTGAGTIAVSCGNVPNSICSNGSYRVTLTGTGSNGNARRVSKLGTYQFTYTETLNGVTSNPATVTITVN